MCDQQRYDCIGFAGIRPVKTPNIDRIAQSGAWFDHAYTPIPVCAPARQSIISGMRPETFGALWNFGISHPVREVPTDAFLYPRYLAEHGYNTAFCGKWNVSAANPPTDYGFSRMVSDSDIGRGINEKYPNQKYENGFFGDPCPVALEDSHTHVLARKASELISEFSKEGKPWFVNVDFQEPHLPCRPSAPFDTMYKPEDIEKWGGFDDDFEGKPYMHRQQVISWNLENRSWEEWSRTVALYYGLISQYDDAIGRILDHLEATDQLKDTVIVYTCDHGDLCGDHRMIDKHYVMYESLTHIPLAIRADGLIKPQKFGGFVQHGIDLAPSILDLLGIDQPDAKLHGESFADALLGKAQHTRDFAVSTYNGQQFGLYSTRAITTADGNKYVWNLSDTDEFYDLNADPHELKNLIKSPERAEIIANLRIKLYNELKRCGDAMIGWTSDQLLKGRKL